MKLTYIVIQIKKVFNTLQFPIDSLCSILNRNSLNNSLYTA